MGDFKLGQIRGPITKYAWQEMAHDCDVEVIAIRCQCFYIKETPTNALVYYLIITLLTLYVTPTCFNP